MIRVHYLEESRAHRILWLLEELGLDYEVELYQRNRDFRAPYALKAIHPLGKSPVIEDGERVMAESGAIIEYCLSLSDRGAALRPVADTEAYWHYLYWLHYSEGSAMPLVTNKLLFKLLPKRVPIIVRPVTSLICKGVLRNLIDPQLKDHVRFWNATLAHSGWFAGREFSAADIAMSFAVEATRGRFMSDGMNTVHIDAFLDAIRARPAYQRALERGGHHYSLAR